MDAENDEESAEVIFWKRIAANFKVPTSGKVDPVAGRWQRWLDSNPEHALAK